MEIKLIIKRIITAVKRFKLNKFKLLKIILLNQKEEDLVKRIKKKQKQKWISRSLYFKKNRNHRR